MIVLEKQVTETVRLSEQKAPVAPTSEMAPESIPGIESWIVPLLMIEGDDMELRTYGGGD